MIQGLRTVIYKVPDLEAAKTWYARVLGFEPYFAEPYYVGFRVGGFELGLDPDMEGGRPGEGMVAHWGVADAAAEFERLTRIGAAAHMPPRDVGGGIVVAAVKDPFRNAFGIVQNPHFSLADVR